MGYPHFSRSPGLDRLLGRLLGRRRGRLPGRPGRRSFSGRRSRRGGRRRRDDLGSGFWEKKSGKNSENPNEFWKIRLKIDKN